MQRLLPLWRLAPIATGARFSSTVDGGGGGGDKSRGPGAPTAGDSSAKLRGLFSKKTNTAPRPQQPPHSAVATTQSTVTAAIPDRRAAAEDVAAVEPLEGGGREAREALLPPKLRPRRQPGSTGSGSTGSSGAAPSFSRRVVAFKDPEVDGAVDEGDAAFFAPREGDEVEPGGAIGVRAGDEAFAALVDVVDALDSAALRGDQQGNAVGNGGDPFGDDAVDEHELLDDAAVYFPSVAPSPPVPGEELLDPQLVRYRMEVQYRGEDFAGFTNAIRKTKRGPTGTVVSAVPEPARRGPADSSGGGAPGGKPIARVVLEDALAVALDLDDVRVVTSCTPEKGVHAHRLTCHVDIPATVGMQSRTVLQRAHAWLSKNEAPLAILSFKRCRRDEQFNAHRAATRRVYVYRIMNRISPPLFERGCHWHLDRTLDVRRMQAAAAKYFEGTIDCRALADVRLQQKLLRAGTGGDGSAGGAASGQPPAMDSTVTVRTIDRLQVVRQEDEILLWFAGKSFIRHQIRAIVGILVYVGLGLWNDREIEALLRRPLSAKRKQLQATRPPLAPTHGLTLWEVQFPEDTTQTPQFVDRGPLDPDSLLKENRIAFGV